MNERIRLLAEQATEYDYTTWDSYNQKEVVHYKFNQQKFAELIVRECADMVRSSSLPDAYSEPCLQDIADDIEEHFGVE